MLQWTKNFAVLSDLHIILLVSLAIKKCHVLQSVTFPHRSLYLDVLYKGLSYLGCEQLQHVLLVLFHAKSPRDSFPRPFPGRFRFIRHPDRTLLGTRHSRLVVQWLKPAHTPHPTDVWHTGQMDRLMLGPQHHMRQETHSRQTFEGSHFGLFSVTCYPPTNLTLT